MQAAITDDPQKPSHASWAVPLACQVILTLAAAAMLSPSDRVYAAYVNPSDSVGSAPAPVFRQEEAGGLDRPRILSSLASYVDKERYYWLDQVRYHYLEAGQYNLLGVETYFWKQYCYPVWHGFPPGRGPCGSYGSHSSTRVNPFVDSFCPAWARLRLAPPRRVDQRETDDLHAWLTYCNPGDYIDRGLYYSLDQGQYYYLEEGQYNLLGGFGYLLGHPCSAMWYDYRPYLWGIILEEAISPPEKALPEWADPPLADFMILGEPAQVGDVLQAFVSYSAKQRFAAKDVSADGTKRVRVGTTRTESRRQMTKDRQQSHECKQDFGQLSRAVAYKEPARPAVIITFGAWDENAGRWYPVGLTRGLAKWTACGGCPTLMGADAVPEPSTIALLALGALTTRRYDKWQTRSRRF